MRALKQFLNGLSFENKQLLIVVICFLGDFISAYLIYFEISDFQNLQRILGHYSNEMISVADILNAPEIQVQIYKMLIQFTITILGLLIFFHAAVYYFFIKRKKFVEFYLKFVSLSGAIFTFWYGLKSLAIHPLFSVITLYGFFYLVAFITLKEIAPHKQNRPQDELNK